MIGDVVFHDVVHEHRLAVTPFRGVDFAHFVDGLFLVVVLIQIHQCENCSCMYKQPHIAQRENSSTCFNVQLLELVDVGSQPPIRQIDSLLRVVFVKVLEKCDRFLLRLLLDQRVTGAAKRKITSHEHNER